MTPYPVFPAVSTSYVYRTEQRDLIAESDLIPLNEVKDLLQIEQDITDYDNRLVTIIQSAIAELESDTGLCLVKTNFVAEYSNNNQPFGCAELDTSNVNSITSVTKYEGGEATIVPSTDYSTVYAEGRMYVRLNDTDKEFPCGSGLNLKIEFNKGVDNLSHKAPLVSSALRHIVKGLYEKETSNTGLDFKISPQYKRVISLLRDNINIAKHSS